VGCPPERNLGSRGARPQPVGGIEQKTGRPPAALARFRARQQGHPIARLQRGFSWACGERSPSKVTHHPGNGGPPDAEPGAKRRPPPPSAAIDRSSAASGPPLGVGEVAIAQPGREQARSRTESPAKKHQPPPRAGQGPVAAWNSRAGGQNRRAGKVAQTKASAPAAPLPWHWQGKPAAVAAQRGPRPPAAARLQLVGSFSAGAEPTC